MDAREGAGPCPFCPGNEGETLPEVAAERPGGGEADSPGWLVRAVPNRYPMLDPGEGAHEVIVHSPRHVARMADLTDSEAARMVATWARRIDALARDPRRLRPFLFVNEGVAAGASLRHSHAQLVGLPFEPPRLAARERAFAEASRCPVCAELSEAGPLVVAAGDGLVAWCPAASPIAGTIRVAPVEHLADWEAGIDPGAIGRAIRRRARELADGLGAEALNVWLNERRRGGSPRMHWHLDIVPRLVPLSGLELGGGGMAVSETPPATAARLRAAGAEGGHRGPPD